MDGELEGAGSSARTGAIRAIRTLKSMNAATAAPVAGRRRRAVSSLFDPRTDNPVPFCLDSGEAGKRRSRVSHGVADRSTVQDRFFASAEILREGRWGVGTCDLRPAPVSGPTGRGGRARVRCHSDQSLGSR